MCILILHTHSSPAQLSHQQLLVALPGGRSQSVVGWWRRHSRIGLATMVHSMDACSGKWRDDPVRAAIEKKQNRENAASRQAASAAHVAALLKAKMEGLEGRSKSTGLSSIEPEPSAIGSDADYRKQLDAQRKRLMDGAGSESDSSESSVFDPWANKRVKREEKRERKEKEKAEKRERKSETPPNSNGRKPITRNHKHGTTHLEGRPRV